MGLSNIPQEVGKSLRDIGAAGKRGYERDQKAGIAKGVNAMADMGVETAKKAVSVPYETIVKPTGKFILSSAATVAKGVVVYTGAALAKIPWIPTAGKKDSRVA